MTKSCAAKGLQKTFFLQNNQVASCCRAYPTSLSQADSVFALEKQWQDESRELDQGHEIVGCEPCWVDERRGIESFRQRSNLPPKRNTFELYLNNTCNQMCSYCSPKFSSTWQQSIEHNGMFAAISASAKKNLELGVSPAADTIWIDRINDYVNQCENQTIHLVLAGGEPLMQIRNLQDLLTVNAEKISTLKIITNLNPPNPKYLSWILEHFPLSKLEFAISIDATPEFNHVPRGKFNQPQFMQNLDLLKMHQVKYIFYSVVSVLSLFDLAGFIKWLGNQPVAFNKINNPDCLDPVYLPAEFKRKILQNLKQTSTPKLVADILSDQTKPVDLKLFEQYNYITQYFQRVDIEPSTVDNLLFQEYWDWLENFVKKKYENRNSQ